MSSFSKIRLGVEEIFELTVKDQNGRKIEDWKCLKKDFPEVMRIIAKKHGLGCKVIKTDRNNQDRDLDWMK